MAVIVLLAFSHTDGTDNNSQKTMWHTVLEDKIDVV